MQLMFDVKYVSILSEHKPEICQICHDMGIIQANVFLDEALCDYLVG